MTWRQDIVAQWIMICVHVHSNMVARRDCPLRVRDNVAARHRRPMDDDWRACTWRWGGEMSLHSERQVACVCSDAVMRCCPMEDSLRMRRW